MSLEGLDRDLENARVLLEEKPWCDSPEKYRKTAEGILVRFLAVDPENKAAKTLLEKSRSPIPEAQAPLPAPVQAPQPPRLPAPVVKPVHKPEESLSFLAQVPERRFVRTSSVPSRKNSAGGLTGIVLIVAIAGVVGFVAFSGKSKDDKVPHAAAAASIPEPVSFTPQPPPQRQAPPQPQPEPQPQPTHVAAPENPAAPAPASVVAVPKPADPAVVVKAAPPVVVPIQTGMLAISSPTTVDIYLAGKLVGSAPTTLELPAGNQNLEYRHEGLRKIVTHVVKANETATAMINFEIPVQINARPWAQVSIDGSQRRQLGQTPLSEVKVPIGSMLLFENPNYQSKTYRVTGKESEIRVSFP